MEIYPKIKAVKPLRDKQLLITFEGKIQKIYDCKPLLKHPPFNYLENNVLFNVVRVDSGGYGIIWNDEIDLSESELWLNGIEAKQAETPIVSRPQPTLSQDR